MFGCNSNSTLKKCSRSRLIRVKTCVYDIAMTCLFISRKITKVVNSVLEVRLCEVLSKMLNYL